MLTPGEISSLILHGAFFVFGLVGNVFILTVIFMDWVKRRLDLYSLELILVSLSIANIAHVCIYFSCRICGRFWVETYRQDKYPILAMFCLRCCSVLFSTVLFIYCCVKILNINSPSFMRLKVKLPGTVPWLLLGCVLIPLSSGLVILTTDLLHKTKGDAIVNTSIVASRNNSEEGPTPSWVQKGGLSSLLLMNTIVASLCLAMIAFSTVAILGFICTHLTHMRHNADGFRSAHMDPYYSAMRTIASFFTLYVLMFISQLLVHLKVVLPGTPTYVIHTFICSSSPALSSLIIILGNSKLRTTLIGVICRVGCCRRGRA